jgi:hypothetical protein
MSLSMAETDPNFNPLVYREPLLGQPHHESDFPDPLVDFVERQVARLLLTRSRALAEDTAPPTVASNRLRRGYVHFAQANAPEPSDPWAFAQS